MGESARRSYNMYAIEHMRHILGPNKIGFGDGFVAIYLAGFVSIIPFIVTVVTVGNKIATVIAVITLVVIAATIRLDSAWRNLKVGVAAWMGIFAVVSMGNIFLY